MPPWSLKNREKLLAAIASQLHAYNRYNVAHIRVRLLCGDAVVKEYLGLDHALDAIVNDIYWDDEGNWADADHAVVDTY